MSSDAESLARTLGVPRVAWFVEVDSTMDVAHALAAEGAAAGTVVLADAQRAGRGRAGKRWASEAGTGVWMTVIERPTDAAAIDVLSLRLGLEAAAAIEPLATGRVLLKWPNDLYIGDRKLAGVLVEARWRDARPEWVAIGLGMNVRAPEDVDAAIGLRDDVTRLDALEVLVPAVRRAAAGRGPLTEAELASFAARDLAAGRRVREPVAGRVAGITAAGELAVVGDDGVPRTLRHGSLVLL